MAFNIQQFMERAKGAEDQISKLESTLKSIVQEKCKQYKYEVLYYGFKNRGNFVRLLFVEAGVPFTNTDDYAKVMAYFRCAGKLTQENSEKLSFDLMAPPAIIRYPVNKNDGEIVALSQTVPIFQFLSEELNLRPISLRNHYLAQSIVANCNDSLSEIFNHRNDAYDDLNTFYTDRMQIWLDMLQKPLTKTKQQEYYFDDKCLGVDICVYNMCEGIAEIMGHRKKELFIDTHPVLYQHYKRIKNRASIKQYVDKQNKKKWEWWPSAYGFGKCRDLLNSRQSQKAEATTDDEKQSSAAKPGGWKQADKDEITAAANAVKSEVEKKAAAQNKPKFTCYEAVSGTKQVVAGMNYKIKVKIGDAAYCTIMVYRSLPPIKYELKNVQFIAQKSKKSGGWKRAEKDEMTAAANAVRSEVEKQVTQNNDDEKLSMYEVVSGTKQVVAGINFKIKLKIGDKRYCEILVYRSLPPISYELKNVKLFGKQQQKTTKSQVGGWKPAEKDEMIQAANAVKSAVEKQANADGKVIKCYEVDVGTKQVVAGINFRIKVKVDSNRFASILVHRSLPPVKFELKKVQWIEPTVCPPAPSPQQKPKAGGWKTADHQEIIAAANSVKQAVEEKRVKDKQTKFDTYQAVSGTKQVVAGINYKIKVKLGKQRFCELVVFRSLPPITCQLKSVKW